MIIETYRETTAFVRAHTARWLDNEAEDGAFLRIKPGADLLCFAVKHGDEVLQTACVAKGDQILFSRASPEVMAVTARFLCERGIDVPGLFAPHPASQDFADVYGRLTGVGFRVVKSLAHHALTKRLDVREADGAFRAAKASDRAAIVAFRDASQWESNTQRPFDSAASFDRDMAKGALYVWDDPNGHVVCTAALCLDRSPRSGHIDDVYTPPEQRRKGYATALVHRLSGMVLAQGRTARLATDVDNTPAIKVYAAIGFEPQCQMDNMRAVHN